MVGRMLRARPACAFTLIELLVVIAIIALLMTLLLPAMDRARQQGKSAACLANLRSLGLAVQTYLQTNNDRFPSFGYVHGGQTTPEKSWVHLMAEEYARRGGDTEGTGAGKTQRGEVRDIRRCPADASPYYKQPLAQAGGELLWRQTSYASNFYLVAEDPAVLGKQETFQRLDRVPRPSSTIFWVELAETGDYATADHVHPELWFSGEPRKVAEKQIMLERHHQRSNYGLVDGHAEAFKFEQTYTIDLDGSDIFAGKIAWFNNKYDPDVAR